MRKLGVLGFIVIYLFCLSQNSFASATTQVDALIKKLVDKGILNEKEAEQIKGEIVSDEKTLREANNKTDIPQWVQDIKLSGDFRLRYDTKHTKTEDDNERDVSRGRIRMRLGLDTNVNDKVKVGIGIATDEGKPRGNNQSFQNTFSQVGTVLNYAYAEYKPNDRLKLTGGKMKNPIWEPFEFLWDVDITPEGGAIQMSHKLSDAAKLFLTLTAFELADISTNQADPFMYVAQGGIEGDIREKMYYKLAGMFNGMDNILKTPLANRSSPATNTTSAGQYVSHYNTAIVGAELGYNDPFGEKFPIYIPQIGIFGSYADNPDPSNKNIAWMLGGYMGNSKVNSRGAWKITGMYRYIGADSFPDTFPDSDFYGGATDVKGYKNILEIGLAKNVSFKINYYRTERIKATKAPESRLQTDLNFKF